MGSAYVDGFQDQTADGKLRGSYLKAVATAKHFALNNVEGLRTAISSNTDETTIREYYTPQVPPGRRVGSRQWPDVFL